MFNQESAFSSQMKQIAYIKRLKAFRATLASGLLEMECVRDLIAMEPARQKELPKITQAIIGRGVYIAQIDSQIAEARSKTNPNK